VCVRVRVCRVRVCVCACVCVKKHTHQFCPFEFCLVFVCFSLMGLTLAVLLFFWVCVKAKKTH